jgi:TonB-dependent SusC/RagA subfamily outer membrane receptor
MNKQGISKLVILALNVLLVFAAHAQEKVLNGIVTTFDSIPLNGAVVKVSGTKQTVFTDSLGQFSVQCNLTDKIKVSAKGFYNQSVKIETKVVYAAVNLKLMAGEKNRELALGIVRTSDYDKLNALASLNSNDIDYSQYRTVFDAIKGRIPGVAIVGGDIIIRGNSSISGPTPALIVVDGVRSTSAALNAMNPAVIKSISVIKDGSSAIYGSQGANGVLVVETKTGRD